MYSILEKLIRSKNDISLKKLETIKSFFTTITTNRNQILLQYDQVCKDYYFINKGCIRLFTTTKDGIDHSRYFAFEGNFATAFPVLLTKSLHMNICKQLKNQTCFVFQGRTFIIWLKRYLSFQRFILKF